MIHHYIGIDIGGTKCAILLGNAHGQILRKARFLTDHSLSPTQILDQLCTALEAWELPAIRSIGVSCGGPLDSQAGLILSPPNLPGWDRVEICKLLRARFGIPVFLQNDANACAVAEWKFGAAKGLKNVIFLTFGTGMGAGLILNGRLYEGRSGFAGEIGHMRMEPLGPVGFGKIGSFEGLCSGGGIAQLGHAYASAAFQKGACTGYCAEPSALHTITAASIARAAWDGDTAAVAVFNVVGDYLGRGLSILMDVLNPDIIVLGSIFTRCEPLLREPMERRIRSETLSSCICPVVPAALGEQIGDIGALCVGMEGCAI